MATKEQELSKLLGEIAGELDLKEPEYENAESKYLAVAKHLSDPSPLLQPFQPRLYPQGSFALGTVVRPIGQRDQYDMDLVCELTTPSEDIAPALVYEMVGERLGHLQYDHPKLESKRRCWRINYSGRFHMDILPAIPNFGARGTHNTAINGVNRATKEDKTWSWHPTDPRGYANWFRGRMKPLFDEIRKVVAAKRGKTVEQIPDYLVKTPLQQAVQILKRHRDLTIHLPTDQRPASILVCTLAAHAYQGETDLLFALEGIVERMASFIIRENDKWWVRNPVRNSENFAEKWNSEPQRKQTFDRWLKTVKEDIAKWKRLEGHQEYGAAMGDRLGGKAVNRALANRGEAAKQERERGNLSVGKTGIITAGITGTSIPGHSFYGE